MECRLCPRECGIDRLTSIGYCGAGDKILIGKVMLHQWEEPCICYGCGSGAVFFSGCQLGCLFCQNHEISANARGSTISENDLAEIFLTLQEKGACNINLVSPTPYIPSICKALTKAKNRGLRLPVVFNSGGYEKRETLAMLDGLIDIYLPDFKFSSTVLAKKVANAPDYFRFATETVSEMVRQTGTPFWDKDKLKRGVIIRNLVLPGNTSDSIKILKHLFDLFGSDKIILSLMRQYTPTHKALSTPPFHRKVTSLEYDRVVRYAQALGFQMIFTQEKESAEAKYIPDFSESPLVFLDKTDL